MVQAININYKNNNFTLKNSKKRIFKIKLTHEQYKISQTAIEHR